MRQNIAQVDTYLKRYCQEADQDWCSAELKSFSQELASIDATRVSTDEELVKQIQWMSSFMSEKYEHFKSIWVGYDSLSMQIGVAMAFHLLLFH